jgi:hypothetical protein
LIEDCNAAGHRQRFGLVVRHEHERRCEFPQAPRSKRKGDIAFDRHVREQSVAPKNHPEVPALGQTVGYIRPGSGGHRSVNQTLREY